jgi:hypothetical protein
VATLIFRFTGMPARYVEGYLIMPEDVAGASENTVFHIDGTRAHAWVEVYQSGVGRIPVEVAPPYIGLMEEADTVEGLPSPDTDLKEEPEPEPNLNEKQPERPEEFEDLFKTAHGLTSFLLPILLLIVMILVFMLLHRYRKYRDWHRRRLISCKQENNNVAVMAMFATGLKALNKLGQETGVWLQRLLCGSVEERTGLGADRLAAVFATYEEAAYSGRVVSVEQHRDVASFRVEMYALLRKRFNGFKRIHIMRFYAFFLALIVPIMSL